MVNEDKLLDLIIKYNCDKELNNLKDILDYLQKNPLYLFTTIKISKRKLFQIPKDDLLMILDNLFIINDKRYFSVFSNQKNTNRQFKYCLSVSIFECLQLIKKMDGTNEIIINPDLKNNFKLTRDIIQYLKG
ncbi:hypothetical protein [Thomasclavelia cocleata]|uniref:Uncharacterized protein n=1 Tax=Thomasclavelia cocleata TaxID=69824 RepID=A0A829ZCJ3_9FIRM|nr:hypothetical protein [Thomasclavelia cocleata]GFI41605.1 hypothetical protein IMSAGC017_01650 [Thomasclavelia cocleata]